MRVALVNPRWTFDGSIYFGCREPHLPLELGYAKALLERAGHEAVLIDGTLEDLDRDALRRRVEAVRPGLTVVTTAPSYLFWRCAPPELRVPRQLVRDLWPLSPRIVAVGPHGSTTPRAALAKLETDAVVMGECEEILPRLASEEDWARVPSIAYRDGTEVRVNGGPGSSRMETLPALRWDDGLVRRHAHHHHRFDRPPEGPGGELEASRGCPYHCTFCAKDNFRDKYRKRPLPVILEELDGLLRQGVEYVYFVDEIFLPDRALLDALVDRRVKFGVQTRIDLWSLEMIDLLARAGCRSIEAGVESLTEEGREDLAKRCRLSTEELTERLLHAKRAGVAFVQANLIETKSDDPAAVAAWRKRLQDEGVWSNDPVPLYPYPGSPDYTRRWGREDDLAWERAHEHYLGLFDRFSDVQDARPLPLPLLEQDGGAPQGPPDRILMTTDAVGGIWTFSTDLARALSDRGTAVVLAVLGPPPSEDQRREVRSIPGLELHERAFRLEWMQDPWDDVEEAGRWLLALEARTAPRIVHLNGYALAAEAWRAPVVVTGHSCVLSWWRAVHGSEPPRAWDAYRARVGRGLACADALAAPTRAMLSALEAFYPVPRRRAVVMNGRRPPTAGPAPKEDLVLGVGRLWDAAKNLEALDAAADGARWTAAVAGDTRSPDGAWRSPRRAQALGRLSGEALAAVYARAAVLAHPARYEPFGLAPLEAARAGCALVLGDIPSLREVWGDAAVYVPPDDPAALRREIDRLMGDAGLRGEQAARSRNRACRFTAERMAASYLDLYADVLAERSAPVRKASCAS